MNLVPYERVSFPSPAGADELVSRLHAAVEPSRWLRNPFSTDHKPYEGTIAQGHFKLVRIIHYRNSWLPTTVGQVRSTAAGAVLEATLRLNPFVAAFMVIWFGGVGVGAVAALVFRLSHAGDPALAIIPAGMFLFGYVLMVGAFSFESEKTKRFLGDLAAAPPSQTVEGAANTRVESAPP